MNKFKWGSTPEGMKKYQQDDFQIDRIEEFRMKLYSDFYEQLDGTVLNIMAAGVPLSSIRLSTPQLDFDGNIATLSSIIKFKGVI